MIAKIFLILLFAICLYKCDANLFENYEWQTGFLKTHSFYDRSIFYYLFKNDKPKMPLIIFIGSGPGCSSSNNLFLETGPKILRQNNILEENKNTWVKNADLLYIDFPFNAGFSKGEYSESELKSLYFTVQEFSSFMEIFKKMHTEYENSHDFYFYCEGFSCQIILNYVKNLIENHESNISRIKKIILKNPVLDIKAQFNWAKFGKSIGKLGILNGELYNLLLGFCKYTKNADFCDNLQNDISKLCNIECTYNYEKLNSECYNIELGTLTDFLTNNENQISLDIKSQQKFRVCNSEIKHYLKNDLYEGNTQNLAKILNHGIKINILFGELDYSYNYEGGLEMANNIDWTYKTEFEQRKFNENECWKEKSVQNFRFTIFKKAGNFIGIDKPECYYKFYQSIME